MLCRSYSARLVCMGPVIALPRLALALCVLLSALAPAFGQDHRGPLKISFVKSQFRDVPATLVQLSFQPVLGLMKRETGLTGEFQLAENANELAEQLASNRVDLGVFHGVEFAWARQKHKDLRPLVIAVNQDRHLRAHVLAAKDSRPSPFADLMGKTLALPKGTRLHCRMFVERLCQDCGRTPQEFFGRIATPANVEDALDDIVDGTAQAAVVDGVALECYQRRKPGRFAKLRELGVSEAFPSSVIVYRGGQLDDTTLNRFKDGMIQAGRRPGGKQILMLWKMTGFEAIPEDYEQTLREIAKAYPPR